MGDYKDDMLFWKEKYKELEKIIEEAKKHIKETSYCYNEFCDMWDYEVKELFDILEGN